MLVVNAEAIKKYITRHKNEKFILGKTKNWW